MKKIFSVIFLLAIMAVQFTACTEDPEVSTGGISGYVTESKGGVEPLAGVTVSIQTTGQSTTTGSDGTYSFTNLQPGSYSLQFTKTGYNTTMRNVNVVAGLAYQCDVQLSKVTAEAEIEINPSSLNFGTTQTDMSVTVKNNGNATAEWSLNLGNNTWLSASELGGSIQAGRTQSIIFTVDRNYLSEVKSVVVNFHAFGNSYPISISCAPRNTTSNMVIEPKDLNFGKESNQQNFTIRNTGKSELSWNVSGISTPALTLSASQGVVAAGGSSVVIASIDRSQLTGNLNTAFIISDGVADQTISVSVSVDGNGGSGDDPGNDPGNNPGNDPAATVVTTGLSAYYQFNDNFDDASGEYDGFGVNDPSFVEGVSKEAVHFFKTKESSVHIPYGLICNKNFSISFWAKDLADGMIYYSKCSDNDIRCVLSMNNGYLRFRIGANNNLWNYQEQETTFSHSNISDSEWHHIAIVTDYGSTTANRWTSILYIDGKKYGTITEDTSSTQIDYINAFVIGGKASFKSYSLTTPNFSMDNLRIYDNRLLTAAEVKEIFNAKQ